MTSSSTVQVEKDVVFGTGAGEPLKGDVYSPASRAGPSAMVLVLRARGSEGPAQAVIAHLLAQRGHIALVSEYRVGFRRTEKGFEPFPSEVWPAPVHDIKAAVRWSRANAERLGIDGESIALFGGSNAAMLALAAAGIRDNPRLEGDGGNPGVSSRVAAVVAESPPTTLTTWGIPLIAGEGASQETVDEISPLNYANSTFPPTMFLHGAEDQMVDSVSSEEMFKKLREAGVPADLHIYAGEDHMPMFRPPFFNHAADMISLFVSRYAAPKG